MIMMYLLFALVFVFCRFFAGYDSRFQKGKCVVIDNPKLRMLLIDEMSFFEKNNRLKKDINKMTVSGIALYIYSLATLVVSVLLHLVVPKTPVEAWEIETNGFFMCVDTLNEKLAAICIWSLFLSIIVCVAFRLFQYIIKTTEQKWIKILTYITCTMMLAAAALMAFKIIKEFVMCLI